MKYINQIEIVEHRAVRYIFNDYKFTSSDSSMLNQLALPTLVKHRKTASLSMFYKINHGLNRVLTRILKTGFIESIPGKSWSQN